MAADSLIRDNKDYGSVGDFLMDAAMEGSEISVVSAYFTIFALINTMSAAKNMADICKILSGRM